MNASNGPEDIRDFNRDFNLDMAARSREVMIRSIARDIMLGMIQSGRPLVMKEVFEAATKFTDYQVPLPPPDVNDPRR